MIPYTSYINVRENRRGNQEWTIQRYWQHFGAQKHRTKTNKAHKHNKAQQHNKAQKTKNDEQH